MKQKTMDANTLNLRLAYLDALQVPPQVIAHPTCRWAARFALGVDVYELSHSFYSLDALFKDGHLVGHARLAHLVDTHARFGDGRVRDGREEVSMRVHSQRRLG